MARKAKANPNTPIAKIVWISTYTDVRGRISSRDRCAVHSDGRVEIVTYAAPYPGEALVRSEGHARKVDVGKAERLLNGIYRTIRSDDISYYASKDTAYELIVFHADADGTSGTHTESFKRMPVSERAGLSSFSLIIDFLLDAFPELYAF